MVLCQFLVLAGNRFWFYILMYLEYKYSCGVVLAFWFWQEIVFGVTYVLSQNENTFLQKNLIRLLYYDPLADVCIS